MNISTQPIPKSEWYKQWNEKIDIKLLCLQNNRKEFLLDKVDERLLKYINNNCLNTVWVNHLLFGVLVSTDRNLEFLSIYNFIKTINVRFKDIFPIFNLTSMDSFEVDIHMYQYLKGDIFPDDSTNKRYELMRHYKSLAYAVNKWLQQKLDLEDRDYFKHFLFMNPKYDSREFAFHKLVKENAQTIRKDDTDAIVPNLPKIRSEANFRWNQIKRLREAFREAIENVQTKSLELPLEFQYDEPERVGERFYFRLWDKPSFVLKQQEKFKSPTIDAAIKKRLTFSDENNSYFLEFIKAESLNGESEVEGLWFSELIENNVLTHWPKNCSIEMHKERLEFLSLWGYDKKKSEYPSPYNAFHRGVITSSSFVSRHQDKVKGLLFDVEPFYTGCTFGLLAIDILTTTGARVNELLQINNTKECIEFKKANGKIHFSFKAIPKGRDVLEDFYISKQTMELIQIVSRMLKEHYSASKFPSIMYRDRRKHLFKEPKPYFFQYAGSAFVDITIVACIRFLLHGLYFETQNGKPVTIKTHLLRHAFATEAVQRQKISIDIVAKILHQKDLKITAYYSAPTPTQIAESVSELQDVISSYVDIDDAYVRSPKELQEELDDYMEKVGVFNKVLGGTCVTDYVCPTKMECLGCKAKVPEPDQEDELLEVIQLSKDMEKRFKQMGLEVEVRKAKEMAKQAKIELKEIDLIKQYREERHYEPITKRNPFR